MKTNSSFALASAFALMFAQTTFAQFTVVGDHSPQEKDATGLFQKQQAFFDFSYGNAIGADKIGVTDYVSLGISAGILLPITDNLTGEFALGYSSVEYKQSYYN